MWSLGWVPLTLVSVFFATPNSCSDLAIEGIGFFRELGSQGPQISPLEHKKYIVSACLPVCHLLCDAGTPAWVPSGSSTHMSPFSCMYTQMPSASPCSHLESPHRFSPWEQSQFPLVLLPTLYKRSKWQMAPGLRNKQKPGGQQQQWAPSWAQADPIPPEGDGWGCPRCPLAWSWAPAGTWLAPSLSLLLSPPHPFLLLSPPPFSHPRAGLRGNLVWQGADWLTLLSGHRLRLVHHAATTQGAWARVGV